MGDGTNRRTLHFHYMCIRSCIGADPGLRNSHAGPGVQARLLQYVAATATTAVPLVECGNPACALQLHLAATQARLKHGRGWRWRQPSAAASVRTVLWSSHIAQEHRHGLLDVETPPAVA